MKPRGSCTLAKYLKFFAAILNSKTGFLCKLLKKVIIILTHKYRNLAILLHPLERNENQILKEYMSFLGIIIAPKRVIG